MNFDSTVFLLGIVGGSLAELLKWYQLRESPQFPHYARKFVYWFVTGLMIVAGGILAVVHGIEVTRPLLALNIGISAPLIIKGLASGVPRTHVPEGQKLVPSLGDFLAGR